MRPHLPVSDADGVDLEVVRVRLRRSWGILVRRQLDREGPTPPWPPSAGATRAPRATRAQATLGAPRSGVGARQRAWTRVSRGRP